MLSGLPIIHNVEWPTKPKVEEETLSMPFVVTAKWVAKEGEERTVRDAIAALIEPSRAEPGNLLYHPNEDPDDPRVFFFYEQYVDEAAYKAHGDSEHFTRLGHELAIPRLESRERAFFRTLGDESGSGGLTHH
jgi:quinol monooxygenase YgiN